MSEDSDPDYNYSSSLRESLSDIESAEELTETESEHVSDVEYPLGSPDQSEESSQSEGSPVRESDHSDNTPDSDSGGSEDSPIIMLHNRARRRNAIPNILAVLTDDDLNSSDNNSGDEEIFVTGVDSSGDEETVHAEEDLLSIASNGYRAAESQVIVLEPETNTTSNQQQNEPAQVTAPYTPVPSTSKRKLSSPKSEQSPKKSRERLSQEDDSDCCPICFEPWSNSGKHRLTSLKCGHLFGQKCIERWIRDAKKCPQCNTKARKADIRVLYAKKLKAIDTTELTEAVTSYESERELRRNKEMELAKVQMQYQMMRTENDRLKSQIENLKNNQVVSSLPSSVRNQLTVQSSSAKKFSHLKNLVISSSGNCRVMDFHAESLSLAISQPSPHTNFMPGFGLKKFSIADMKSSQFNILHSKAIKDVSFSPHNSMVLTASQDETLKITNWDTNSNIHTYKLQRPVWCCCWDSIDSNLLYGGLNNGSINCYDLRYTTDVLHTISNPVSRCPIVSMYNIPRQANPDIPGGLLVQTLGGVTFWQNAGDSTSTEYEPHYLPLQPGNCAGLKYSNNLKQCLVTYRPGRSYPCTTHILCQLEFKARGATSIGLTTDILENYRGGQSHKMLTRNALFSSPDDMNFVCVSDEAKKTVNVYEARAKGGLIQTLSCSGPVLDILPMFINDRQLLATLTDKELKIYEQK